MELMDTLISVWSNQELDEVDRAAALDEVFDARDKAANAKPQVGASFTSVVVDGVIKKVPLYPNDAEPKGPRLAREPVKDDGAEVYTQGKSAIEIAEEARINTLPQEGVVQDYINEVLKNQILAGGRNLCIPLRWKGRALSFNADRWKAALEMAGLSFGEILWVKDDRTWVGKIPSYDELPLTLA